jgi:hypothetical protein
VTRQPFGDLLVVIPGIMGSVLTVDGRDVWTVEGRKLLPALARLASTRKRLQLPSGLGDRAPNDGVEATRLLPDLHAIPGFWTINGYGQLLEFLTHRFTLAEASSTQPGNLVCFAYDWRLSNRWNGQHLAERIDLELTRWQRHSSNDQAKVVFLCHSMGGLVARWYIDILDGHKHTRKLITIGTPYQGAPRAIDALVNGVRKGLWPLEVDLTAMVRSFPSVYQLLPTYPCVDPGSGTPIPPAELALPNLDPAMLTLVQDAAAFHSELRAESAKNAGRYPIYALKGHLQPTLQIARLQADQADRPPRTSGATRPLVAVMDDREGDRDNPRGDGTVPRGSSHPPNWESEEDHPIQGFAQAHASLQNTDTLHASLFQILTADRLGKTAGGLPLSVATPDLVQVGESIPITVTADSPTLVLHACIDDAAPSAVLLANEGDGHYRGTLPPQPAGEGHTVTVYSVSPLRPIDPVTTVVTVWNPAQTPTEAL